MKFENDILTKIRPTIQKRAVDVMTEEFKLVFLEKIEFQCRGDSLIEKTSIFASIEILAAGAMPMIWQSNIVATLAMKILLATKSGKIFKRSALSSYSVRRFPDGQPKTRWY